MSSLTLAPDQAPEFIYQQLAAVTAAQVERSLAKSHLEPHDLLHLLAPAAEPFMESMAQKAFHITRQRFGATMKLYAPLYLSNVCSNDCIYCGFNQQHHIARRTLRLEEVEEQAAYLADQGFQNILLVSGEAPKLVAVDYLEACVQRLRPRFPEVAIEVYPLEAHDYERLARAGLYGLVIYQETYLPQVYDQVHRSGPKKNYAFRLATPGRGAAAGVRQVGLGVLLGLTDFRLDAYYLGLHARQLQKHYWRTAFGLSFPRIIRATGNFKAPAPVTDKQLVQMVTALRLFLPDAPFSLSTREAAALRRHLLPLGFTQMSAGSCTAPGGYGHEDSSGLQFEVEDSRPVAEVVEEVKALGLEPVWKDWDGGFA